MRLQDLKAILNMNKIIVPVFFAIACSAIIVSCLQAEEIITGANISAEARVIIERKRPGSTFDTQKLPSEPDYASKDAWAALPDKIDLADVAPLNTKYPEAQARAQADVFFIHPTTAVSEADNWNIPIDDPLAAEDLSGILAFGASAFNSAAKVYAPRYRQATFYAFFDDRTTSGIKAIDLAYHDVEKAFLYYIKYYNHGRAFILAGHSQGSMHGSRLLQEHIINKPLMKRMIAAYLIGGTTLKTIPGILPSRSATDTGVIIGWNTYTKDGDPGIFTNGLIGWVDGAYKRMDGRPLLQTNPLSWKLNGPEVPPLMNPGSLPSMDPANKMPLLAMAVCGADASGEVLLINKPTARGFTLPDAFDIPVLNDRYGDYHNFDYQLFYESIRKNCVERVQAFQENKQ